MRKKLLFIANPKSGRIKKDQFKSAIYKKLKKTYKTEIYLTQKAGDGYSIVKEELKNYDIFSAFGGDGTINEIGSALVFENKPLGIIPGGSGNGLARGLGIPKRLNLALDILIQGKTAKIDSGCINNKYFFNIAGIGLDALAARDFNEKPLGRGIFPYVLHTLKNYLTMKAFKANISVNNQKEKTFKDIILLCFSNFKEWGGNTYIAPYASPYDGNLDLCIVEKFPLYSGILNLPRLFIKKVYDFEYYDTMQFKKLKLKTQNPKIFHFDGEKGKKASTFEIEAFPSSLSIIVP